MKYPNTNLVRKYVHQEFRVDELRREIQGWKAKVWNEETRMAVDAIEVELEKEERRRRALKDRIETVGGKIEVIYGCMFAGKTDELIRRINRMRANDQKTQIFKHAMDKRYGVTEIVSHDGIRVDAIPLTKAKDIYNWLGDDPAVVAIDEAQFFDDDITEVCELLANLGKHIILAGLNLDFRGEPFGPMPELIVRADRVTQLTALCKFCKEPATRTQRLVDGRPASYYDPVVQVGGTETYQARCRHCHEVPDKP